MTTMQFWNWQGDILVLRCQIQARAASDEIVGEHAGRLRIRIRAVPADGVANQRLRRLLADEFGVAPGAVTIGSGHCHRYKAVHILGPVHLPAWLAATRDGAHHHPSDPGVAT